MVEDNNMDILLQEFSTYVGSLEKILMELENSDEIDVSELSMLLHSLKGLLGFIGPSVSEVVTLIHEYEDQIQAMSDVSAMSDDLLSRLFDLVDGLRLLGELLPSNPSKSQVLKCFKALKSNDVKIKLEKEYMIKVFLGSDMKMKSTRVLSYINVLKRQSTIVSVEPAMDLLYDDFEDFEKVEFNILSRQNLTTIKELVNKLPGIRKYEVSELTDEYSTNEPTEVQPSSVASHYSMDQGEINKISTILEDFLRIEKLVHKLDITPLENHEKKLLSTFKRKILDIQESMTLAQKVPLSYALNPLQRIVRDTSKKYNKSVQLYISGDHQLLDRSIVERLSDPLVVLLQNAIIHGVESDEERKSLGKSVPAIVSIEVLQDSGNTIIRVFDNGRGIDYNKVWKKGVELGMVSGDYDVEKAKQLLFNSSFSTVDEISTDAGRGMGLYHIKKFVLSVNGKINVKSTKGENTIFELAFPIQNNISSVILVKIQNKYFGFPETHVQRIFRLKEGEVVYDEADVAFKFKTHTEEIKTINLSDAFQQGCEISENGAILLWDNGLDRVGFYVDQIVTFEEMSINYLDPVAEISSLFSGTASLGTGDMVFLLQPHAFLSKEEVKI